MPVSSYVTSILTERLWGKRSSTQSSIWHISPQYMLLVGGGRICWHHVLSHSTDHSQSICFRFQANLLLFVLPSFLSFHEYLLHYLAFWFHLIPISIYFAFHMYFASTDDSPIKSHRLSWWFTTTGSQWVTGLHSSVLSLPSSKFPYAVTVMCYSVLISTLYNISLWLFNIPELSRDMQILSK